MEQKTYTDEQLKNPIKAYGTSAFLKFLIPSILGVLFFLIPVRNSAGTFTIVLSLAIDAFTAFVTNANLIKFGLGVLTFSALSGIFTKIFKPQGYTSARLNSFFNPGWVYLVIRIGACIFGWMVFLQVGPEFIISSKSGGMSLNSLLPSLITTFFFCGFFLPLLLNFGAMEFIGSLIRKFMRPLFTIPGRSALDCLASFIGSGTVGIVITTKQYDEGYYTEREAAIISVCFSICSLPFALTVARTIGVDHQFFAIYGSVIIACIILAIILPRIWPLHKISDEYYAPVGKQINEEVPSGTSPAKWGVVQGIERAAKNTSWMDIVKEGATSFFDIWMNLNPMVVFCGTIAMGVANFTPIFDWISLPMKWILELLALPDAAAAAPATIIGFCGMFIPATLMVNVEAEMTKFFICILELVQLLYISENVALLLKSNIRISFWKLFVVFMERTLISIPIIALITHLIY